MAADENGDARQVLPVDEISVVAAGLRGQLGREGTDNFDHGGESAVRVSIFAGDRVHFLDKRAFGVGMGHSLWRSRS